MRKFLTLAFVLLSGCYSVSQIKEPMLTRMIPRDERKIIAVIDFDNNSGDPAGDSLVKGVYARMISGLDASNKFRIIERKKLESVLSELGLQMAGLANSGKTEELGKLLGADALLFGEITSVKYSRNKQSIFIMWTEGEKTEVAMNARLVDVKTGELLASASADSYVKQRNWVAFWFARLGRKMDKQSVMETAVDTACKQLSIDISENAYR